VKAGRRAVDTRTIDFVTGFLNTIAGRLVAVTFRSSRRRRGPAGHRGSCGFGVKELEAKVSARTVRPERDGGRLMNKISVEL